MIGLKSSRTESPQGFPAVIVKVGSDSYTAGTPDFVKNLNEAITNAFKHAFPFSSEDRISIRLERKGKDELLLVVADNGRGIDPKDHQRIFDLFRRAGTQDRPGQGIGLAHVRALVRRLGGTMSVASELHNGSTFTITLPATWSATNRNRDS